jgi:hypothetical protein
MVQVKSLCDFTLRTIKHTMLSQARPFGKPLDREQPLFFAWNAGIRAYNYTDLMARQWQMLNP